MLAAFASSITFIELDAVEKFGDVVDPFFKRVNFRSAIAGKKEKRRFYQRRFQPCSSFLLPDENVVRAFALEQYFELDRSFEADCLTLKGLLRQAHVKHIDFLKTDLEGLDHEVLQSAPDIVQHCLAVQSELRFQPLYRGEPYFEITVAMLRKAGLELITVKPEYWKFETKTRDLLRDGRLVWGDFVFFLTPKKVRERFGKQAGLAFCKQIIIAKVLGLNNYATYIFEQNVRDIPEDLLAELQSLINDTRGLDNLITRSVNKLASTFFGRKIFPKLRRILARLSSVMTIDRNLKHIGTL